MSMSVHRLIPRSSAVRFIAMDVTDAAASTPRATNDNNCPYCGGVLEPGDKASDCSGSKALPMMPSPKGRGASR
jgi:hypothetical protein